MQPKAHPPQSELFGARLSELLNPEHPLYVLTERIDWSQFDAGIDACYADELGRPGVNTRLMVGLLYMKYAFDESDESVVARCKCHSGQNHFLEIVLAPVPRSAFSSAIAHYAMRSGLIRATSFLIACAASHKSTAR